jgi:hypothetical protein
LGEGVAMKKRAGRKAVIPTKPVTTLTLRISREEKVTLIEKSSIYDMSLTEYLMMLVARDGS